MYEIPRIRRRSRLAIVARKLGCGATGVHLCIVCGSDCVCPVEWGADGPEHWLITLRCPECDVWRTARITNEEATAYDLELDRQMARIERALAAIEREHMRATADAFGAALKRDLIGPADFAER
jgi:hypothetical protein